MFVFPKIVHCANCERIIRIIYDPKKKQNTDLELCNTCKMKIGRKYDR